MCDLSIYQIAVTAQYRTPEFREDLKTLYSITGVENKPTSFLFNDTQVVEEQFLEIVNNMLSTGEVANLYKSDEMEDVSRLIRSTPGASFHLHPYIIRYVTLCIERFLLEKRISEIKKITEGNHFQFHMKFISFNYPLSRILFAILTIYIMRYIMKDIFVLLKVQECFNQIFNIFIFM